MPKCKLLSIAKLTPSVWIIFYPLSLYSFSVGIIYSTHFYRYLYWWYFHAWTLHSRTPMPCLKRLASSPPTPGQNQLPYSLKDQCLQDCYLPACQCYVWINSLPNNQRLATTSSLPNDHLTTTSSLPVRQQKNHLVYIIMILLVGMQY